MRPRRVVLIVTVTLGLLAAPLPAEAQRADGEIEQLIKSFADDKLRRDAFNQVYALGTPAVPHLVKALSDPDVNIRKNSLLVILAMFTSHPQVLAEISVDRKSVV